MSLGFISPRSVRQVWHPWDCYPNSYETISESLKYGDRARLNVFSELGFRCEDVESIKTSVNVPSIHLVKRQELLNLNAKETDDHMLSGATSIRDPGTGYISVEKLRRLGSLRSYPLHI